MNEKQLRETAIEKYENGKCPKEIYRSLGKSKRWFFKWLKRYHCAGESWSQSKSKRPHHSPNKVDETMEQLVIDTRKSLEKEPYAQIGAYNISWHLSKKSVVPPPIPTINKILKRNNLIKKHRHKRYQPKGTVYPKHTSTKSNDMHQFDLVGPRYLKNDGRFFSAHIIDTFDRRCNINPVRTQNRFDLLRTLLRCWHMLGIPQYLQMDNLLSIRGSNRFPHSFGIILRLCLVLGIQPVFIPIREPWRNGIVEHFQDVFDKKFYRIQLFKSFAHLVEKARNFELFHNKNHRYSCTGRKSPLEAFSGDGNFLPAQFKVPKKLYIVPGCIHLIRFIRSNLQLDVFGEKLSVPKTLEYEYVKATIDTKKQKLFVHHDSKIVKQYDYRLPKTPIILSKN